MHKMLDRWGPNAKEMRAIVKYIAQHNIHLKHAPLVSKISKTSRKTLTFYNVFRERYGLCYAHVLPHGEDCPTINQYKG